VIPTAAVLQAIELVQQWWVIRMWKLIRGVVYTLHDTIRMKSADRATRAVSRA
jgi:hypothetical protein